MGWLANKSQAWRDTRSASARANEAEEEYWGANQRGDEQAKAAADCKLHKVCDEVNEAGGRLLGKYWPKAWVGEIK